MITIIAVTLFGCADPPPPKRDKTDPPKETDTDDFPTVSTDGFTLRGSLVVGPDRDLPAGEVTVALFGVQTWYAGSPEAGWISVNIGPLVQGEVAFSLEVPELPLDVLLDDYPYNTKYGGKYGTGTAHIGLGAYIDAAGDGPDELDVYVATHTTQLLFSYGFYEDETGWILQNSDGTITPITGDLNNISLVANLLPIRRGDLSARILNDRTGLPDQHLALIRDDDPAQDPLTVVSGVDPGPGAVVALSLPSPPASAEQEYPLGVVSLPHMQSAPYVAVVWSDTDGDGLPGEPVIAATPEAADGVRAVYLRPKWFVSAWLENGTGWYLTRDQDGQVFIPWLDGLELGPP